MTGADDDWRRDDDDDGASERLCVWFLTYAGASSNVRQNSLSPSSSFDVVLLLFKAADQRAFFTAQMICLQSIRAVCVDSDARHRLQVSV